MHRTCLLVFLSFVLSLSLKPSSPPSPSLTMPRGRRRSDDSIISMGERVMEMWADVEAGGDAEGAMDV